MLNPNCLECMHSLLPKANEFQEFGWIPYCVTRWPNLDGPPTHNALLALFFNLTNMDLQPKNVSFLFTLMTRGCMCVNFILNCFHCFWFPSA